MGVVEASVVGDGWVDSVASRAGDSQNRGPLRHKRGKREVLSVRVGAFREEEGPGRAWRCGGDASAGGRKLGTTAAPTRLRGRETGDASRGGVWARQGKWGRRELQRGGV